MKTMKALHAAVLLALGVVMTAGQNTRAQEADPVLDLLVKHHVISDQEAENARAEIEKDTALTPAGKLDISTPVTELKLFGDIRERFAINEAGATNGDHSQVNRFRLRLRIGVEVRLVDNWLLGVRLETANGGNTGNVTEGTLPDFGKGGTTTSSFVSGATSGKAITGITTTSETVVTATTPKVKTGTALQSVKGATGTVLTGVKTSSAITAVNFGYTVFVGQLYLRYKPAPWLIVQAGKVPNPLLSTAMVWDPDINPEGFTEQFSYRIKPFGDPENTSGKEKNVKPSWKDDFSVDLFANLAQYVYSSNEPANAFGNPDSTPVADKYDTFLLAWQAGAKVNFRNNTSFQVAPTYYSYTNHTNQGSSANFQGDGPLVIPTGGSNPALFVGFNQTGINQLSIIDVPSEFDWQMWKVPFSVFGDYAYNTEAKTRAARAGHADQGNQDLAYQVGLSAGTLQKKGDWNIKAYWQQSDQYALDPNLVENNVFDGRLNMRGPVLTLGYNFTDAVTLAFTYNYGVRVDSNVGTGGSANAFSLDPLHTYSFYYWDLLVKF